MTSYVDTFNWNFILITNPDGYVFTWNSVSDACIRREHLNEILSSGRTDCGARTVDPPERASVLTSTATLPLDSEELDHLPPLAVKLTAVEVLSLNWKLKASGIT